MRSGPCVCIPSVRQLGEEDERTLAAPADSMGVVESAALALPSDRDFEESLLTSSLAFLLAASSLKHLSATCPGLLQKAQIGFGFLDRREDAEAGVAAEVAGVETAAAAATPVLCASSFLSASSTCCTAKSDCASRDVVRAVYFVPWSRTEMRNSRSESSSE